MGTRLSALDIAFLGLETQKTPVNVAGLQILAPPPGYQGNFVRDLLDQLADTQPQPPFNLKLNQSRLPWFPEWVIDKDFDLGYHVRHSALPRPGTEKDLLSLVARLHSRVMDRQRPLWEFHVIEGLADGNFAIYTKLHHSAVDGMGGIAMLEACFSRNPETPANAPWCPSRAQAQDTPPAGLYASLGELLSDARRHGETGLEIGKMLMGHGMKSLGLRPDDSPVPFTAPKSLFNVPISGARRLCVRTVSLKEVRSAGRVAGATMNDTVLGLCASALRRYLLEKNALPKETLIATVPVSVRQINRLGNQITYVGARLATHLDDPLARLQQIHASTTQAKQEVAEVSAAAATNFAMMAQGLVAVLSRLQLTEYVPPPANVLISNVPGPRRTLYFGGARLLASYPLSVLTDGQALNITVVSYCDSIDFGLMACRNAVPDVEKIGDYLLDAVEELKQATAGIELKAPAARAKQNLRRLRTADDGSSREHKSIS